MKNKEEKQKKLEEILKSKTYYGCAEDIYLTDERRFRWLKEREKYGYDSTDLWSLDITIMKFMIPRLKDIVRIRSGTFLKQDLFIFEMNTVIKFFEIYLDFNSSEYITPKERDEMYDEAFSLFVKNFPRLWY
jgi:hypothetical protein